MRKGTKVRVICNVDNERFYQIGATGKVVRQHTRDDVSYLYVEFNEGADILPTYNNSWWVPEADVKKL
jgi:hypothetical protein